MKLLTCPHCGHAFKLKSPEVHPFSMSRQCPSCNATFTFGMRWSVFLLMFVPLVLLGVFLHPWLGSWGPFFGVALVTVLSVRLVKVEDEEESDDKPAG
jgi:uncharacterized paraquat-inducible protein A